MATAEMLKRKREEYEMQLFGFHSRAVNATLKSLMQDKIHSLSHKLCESLEKKYKPDGNDIQILKANRTKLAKAYYRGCKTHMPAIENLVNKLIVIPQHILLDEDKIQETQYTEAEHNEMTEKLKKLQHKIKAAIVMNSCLKNELAIVEQVEVNVEMAKTLCTAIKNGSKYLEENHTVAKLIEDYKTLERQRLDFKHPPKRTKINYEFMPKEIDINVI